jgi:hypothetical protein
VQLELSGGTLRRSAGGATAEVEALVTNRGDRALLGLRLAAYYDVLDALPASDAQWRLHEFLLEPALAAGATTQLQFSDEQAAQYVLLRLDYARFALALAVDGAAPRPAQSELLERDGVQYLAARDLASALGARLAQGADKRVTLALPAGGNLAYRAGSAQVMIGSTTHTLAHPVLEQDGRSWLPLHETCALLGYEADYDLGENLLRLSQSP